MGATEERSTDASNGFDGNGFGGYLLPYAGGLLLTLLLTSAAFSGPQ